MNVDDQQALTRERYRLGMNESFAFSYVLIVLVVVMFRGQSSGTGLVLWAAAVGLATPLPKLINAKVTRNRTWYWTAVVGEVVYGIAFGSITWLALPSSHVYQALLAAILTGVCLGASISAARFRLLNNAFVVPFTTVAAAGYLVAPDGLTIAVVILGVAFLFGLLVSEGHRERHVNLHSVIHENELLVDELQTEHKALISANHRLDAQAWTDSLTGLANRPAVMAELHDRLAKLGDDGESKVTVAYLDLNGFKQINDTWGHRTGDQLLIVVAEQIRRVIGEDAIGSRLGGDEFVVIESIGSDALGEALAAAFREPLQVGDRQLAILASIGVASTIEPTSADELLRFADKALYEHKESGSQDEWRVFDRAMRNELAVRRRVEGEIHYAFDAGDITTWFQPVVDLVTGKIVSIEALVRWEHITGVRTAGAFLDVLIEEGMLDALTERTFEIAHDLQNAVVAAGRERPRVNINVAPQQLEQVLTAKTCEGDLDCISIEITEDSAIPNPERATRVLKQARELGARVLVDDFGIGYSGLARTAALPIDGIKIDRSFVSTLSGGIQSAAVISTIVDLADKLDLSVIAEGIETTEQRDELLRLGVPDGQGFLFSPAVPAAQIIEWLAHDHRFGLDSGHGPMSLPDAA